MNKTNYKAIYQDIIAEFYPHKKNDCQKILAKKELLSLDIINLNNIIFGHKDNDINNGKFKSYNEDDIIYILNYKKKYDLNITQLSKHFNLSRNTIAKWIKIYKNI